MLDSGELKIELPLHVLLLCVEDLDQLELDVGDGLFLDFESGVHVLFDVFCESEQTLIVVVNLLHEFIVCLIQACLNLINVLTNRILFLSRDLKLALSLLISFVVLGVLVSAHSELIGDL